MFGLHKSTILIVTAVFSAVLILLFPLQSTLLLPTFSNLAILRDLPFVISFLVTCILFGIIWLRHEDRITMLIFSVFFTVMYTDSWEFKVPNGEFLSTAPNYASELNLLISHGHLPGFTIGSPANLLSLVALRISAFNSVSTTFWGFSIFYSVCIGMFIFLLANELVGNERIGALVALISILSNPLFISLPDSLYAPRPFGTLMFLILLYLFVLSYKRNSNALVPLTILFTLLTVSYVLDALIFALMMVTVYMFDLLSSKRRRFVSASGIAILLNLSILGSWITLNAYTRSFIIGDFFRAFLFNVPSGGGVSHPFNLITVLRSHLNSQPLFLGFVLFWWLLFVYGIGGLIWVRSFIVRRSLTTMITAPVILVGILLFFLPGGSEIFRISDQLSLLLSAAIGIGILRSSQKIPVILCFLSLLLALPTMAAYYPNIGSATQYTESLAAGSYLRYSVCQPYLLTPVGTSSLDNIPNTALSAAPALTEPEALQYWNSTLRMFFSTQCAVLNSSQVLYSVFTYTYGANFTRTFRIMLNDASSEADLVYSNNVTQLYISASST
jgi:hypothetical protein